jgi:hypothetical protein
MIPEDMSPTPSPAPTTTTPEVQAIETTVTQTFANDAVAPIATADAVMTDPDAAPQFTAAPAPTINISAAAAKLNVMEQHALFWGGEVGTAMRNHINELRALLGLV